MKKILTVMLAVAMLASLACVSTSAQVRLVDKFDAWVEGGFWLGSSENTYQQLSIIDDIDGDSMLVSPPEARVHQGHFTGTDDNVGYGNGNGTITTGTFWVTVYTTIIDSDTAGAGLWWKNTYPEVEEGEKSETFTVKYFPGDSSVVFRHEAENLSGDEEQIVVKWTDPKQRGENASDMVPVVLGMRVDAGKISAFVDGQCIGSYEDPTIGSKPCPVVLWNDGLQVYWNDFTVGDLAELPLNDPKPNPGPDDSTAAPNPDTTVAPPVTKVETKVEQVTDENGNAVTDASGNAVTQVVTEIVTVPSADLNNGASGNGGAQTGDMAVVVLAVMITALGSAIVVKKVSCK